ncbi:Protein of unknown function [Roseovarius litoreus]|uniref:VWFA domain-containing protein n=1 Tax=Roseovarius litoreus TaxID=1155722 RepID=A0A1M7F907_9RHOB|nr:DUF1194 domain-containing protein [Roseovarius litoreus]SHM00189.1 Protein of unknown function [Roseovarius litoreus]
MRAALAALWLCAALAAGAQAACRQALALGVDVSGSVDAREYRLQLDGLAAALRDAQVQRAFLAMPQAPVRLLVFEWAGLADQRRLAGWRSIDSAQDLEAVARRLESTQSVYEDPATAIGSAMLHGAMLLGEQAECWSRTLDISGDGPANRGPHPGDLRGGEFDGITINALVIGPGSRANTTKDLTGVLTLEAYYRAHVLRGRDGFVETARDFEDFADAMRRKLLREVAAPVLSQERTGGARPVR